MGLDRRKNPTRAVDRRHDDEQRARIDAQLRTAAADAAREAAWRVGAIVFFALLSLIIGATVWQQTVNARLNHAAAVAREASDRLDRSEMRACERLQAQRERTNVSEARQYLLLRAIATSPRATKRVAARYDSLSRTTLYDPPTDCIGAVQHPNSYRRPASVSFYALPNAYVEAVVSAAKAKRPQPIPHP